MPPHTLKRTSDLLTEYGVRPFAIAGAFVSIALLGTFLLQHITTYPFVFFFFGAVMGSAWFGGFLCGFLSVLLSGVALGYFFMPPSFSIAVSEVAQSYLIAFIVCAAIMSWMSAARKRSEDALREARDRLEERVLERTAEIQRSHAEIVESGRRLRLLTEAIPQQIWSAMPDGRVEYCNQRLLDYVGRSTDGMRDDQFISVFHTDDQIVFREVRGRALASGEKFEGEWRIQGADDQYRWFLVQAVPQRAEDGQIVRWYGTHSDIEERRRAEQALIQAQSELSDLSRTFSLGELAASIAHELNQPLTAVVTHAYACREWLASEPANLKRASATAEKIVLESTRASQIIARVRALFQRGEQTKQRIEIDCIVKGLIRLLRDDVLHREVLVRTNLTPNLPRIEADPVQIQQVLLNLATNGMDAMADITGVRELIISTGYSNAGDLLVSVEDNGAGIDAGMAAKVFQPFFTTKPHGVGLGLAISRSIVEAHGGRLWITPRPLGGTMVQFTIPVTP